jgi:hypothetical protein
VEDRHWWSKYIISFFLLFWFGITILVCFNAVVFGETLAGIAEVNLQLKIPLQEWVAALNLPLTAIALIILALGLYLLTPENYLTIRQALPGAILFAIGWLGVTKLFQLYVSKYDRYNPTYHALASIIILLTWMYLTCLLLLLGGKLNAILRREHERGNSAPVPQPAWDLFCDLRGCSLLFVAANGKRSRGRPRLRTGSIWGEAGSRRQAFADSRQIAESKKIAESKAKSVAQEKEGNIKEIANSCEEKESKGIVSKKEIESIADSAI